MERRTLEAYKYFKINFLSTLLKAFVKSIKAVSNCYLSLLTYLCIRVYTTNAAYKVFLVAKNSN